MTVIRPNSVSGITSITAQANEINFFRSNGALAGLQLNGVNFNTTTGVSTFNNLDVGGVLTYQDVTNVDSIGIITARSTIDAQGDVSIADKIIHTGDTNTAIRFPAVDTISFETSGSERARISSNGKLGVGINDPQNYFSSYNNLVVGKSSDTGGITIVSASGSGGSIAFAKGTSGNQAYRGIIRYDQSNDSMTFGTDGGTERLRIASNGNIRIGSGAPALAVGSGLEIDTGGAATIRLEDSGSGSSFEIQNTGGSIKQRMYNNQPWVVEYGSGEKFRIDSAGKIGVGKNPDTKVEVQLSAFAATGDDDASDWGANGIFQLLHQGTAAANNEVLLLGAVSGAVGQIASGLGFGRESTSNWGTYLSFKTHSTSTSNIDELKERLRIASDGIVTSTATHPQIILKDPSNRQISLRAPSTTYQASVGTDSNHALSFYTNGYSNERMRITNGGNVAIGNASPQQLLHVWPDTANTTSAYIRVTSGDRNSNTGIDLGSDADGNGRLNVVSNGDLKLYSNNTERLNIKNTGAFYIKSPSYIAGDQPGEIQWWNENGAGVMAKIVAYREGSTYAPSGLKFYTTQNVDTSANNSQGDITERLFINSEGKFYKGGHQFYPCVQIYEARLSGSVSNSSVGSYQDIKTVATYTPKKVGNRVHVQVICQSWNGSQTDGASDAYARLQHNNGGSYSTFTECDRVQGNFSMDERYHHNPFIMDGWFTTTSTNSTTIKFQGMQYGSLPTAFNWFHSYGGRVTIMEYDIT